MPEYGPSPSGGAAPTGVAGGDLSGTFPDPTVAKINGSPLGTLIGAPTSDAIVYNGTEWIAIPSVYNVMAFGATGGGVVDDTVAIAAAITACETAGGGTVFFPTGYYKITPTSSPALSITHNGVTLMGANRNTTFLRKTANGIALALSGTATGVANHLSDIKISDLGFHGGTFTGLMFQCYYSDNFTFDTCAVTQNNDVVLDSAEFWDSRFINCTWDTNGGALSTTTPNIWLRNSAASSGFGYSTDSVNQIYFIGNRFEAFTQGAVRIEAGVGSSNTPQGIYFTDNKMESSSILGSSHLYVDGTCQQIFVNTLYVYAGALGGGASAVTPITWHPYDSTIENVTIANSGTATVVSGMDWYSQTNSVAKNVIGRYGTNPTTSHINFNASSTGDFDMENCFAATGGTQYSGTIPTSWVGGAKIRIVAGVPADGSFTTTPINGTLALDSQSNRLYSRIGGVWNATSPPLPLITGYYYPNYAISTAASGSSLTTGQLHAYPVWVGSYHTFQSVGVWVTTAGTSAILRFGIYADNGSGLPGALIVDLGTASAPTGAQVVSVATTQALSPGLYWLCLVQNSATGACTVLADTSSRNNVVFGQSAIAATQAQESGYKSQATTYTGALPGTFPSSVTAELAPNLQIEA